MLKVYDAVGAWVDLNWLLQLIATAVVVAVGLIHILKSAASKIMIEEQQHEAVISRSHVDGGATCVVCGELSTKQCSACKLVRYCSTACQKSHWNSEHKRECKDFQLFGKCDSKQASFVQKGRKGKAVALVPGRVHSNSIKPPREILFPYEDFLELYNWDKAGFPPCGLLNCGNSCFANVILQCLSSTKLLAAYLLEKGHNRECRRNDWCFLCELQTHIERTSTSRQPFSPLNILSRLPNIGGNLGYGKQEDAHEFMRFAIDAMQSVCLDEFGGEKMLHPSTQETTLIQHIFGGHLQSQVVCSKCGNVSNQCENMMELNVEIHGDAASLEECLDQFTAKEQLHGDNLYKCDNCNDYVMAWKRLMVRRAPNVLTIALKRFQSGRFGKLNKKVTFPETLDLSPYTIEQSNGNDVYKLYAVVVHVDMLNASFFGHYICYTKDFHGNWYRIDDCKVSKADLEEVLSEGAYMLLYSRVSPRPSCLKEQDTAEVAVQAEQSVESLSRAETSQSISSNSEPIASVQTDILPSSISDDVAMTETITTQDIPASTVTDDVAMTDTITTQDIPASTVSDDVAMTDTITTQDIIPSTVSDDVGMTETITTQDIPASTVSDDGARTDTITTQDIPVSTVSDDVAMTDTISTQDLESGKEFASLSVQTDGLESPHLEIEINEVAHSSHEISQSSEDDKIALNEENRIRVDNFSPVSRESGSNSKQQSEKLESDNGFSSSKGQKGNLKANEAKVKPLFTPGFLGKRPGNNPKMTRGKCASNGVQKPNPE